PGAGYDFKGNSEVGSGSLQIVQAEAPSRVQLKLDMTAPMEAHNDIVFSLVPEGNGTRVTWAMEGPCPFLGKVMGVVFNMDRMVGGAFEEGLADLKSKAEKA
ncbi:MAG: polyketide cyclase, partial [Comamonadaceae bacterium]